MQRRGPENAEIIGMHELTGEVIGVAIAVHRAQGRNSWSLYTKNASAVN